MDHVRENYRILGQDVGFDPSRSVLAVQVHGCTCREVTEEDHGKGLLRPQDFEADALMTNVPGTALFVFSADCETILLEDPDSGAVCACHAGWRGTAQDIAGECVRRMHEVYGSDPARLRAALGPCIGKTCFETDKDVPDAMIRALGDAAEEGFSFDGVKYHVDLRALNRLFLIRAGLHPDVIDVSTWCTACNPDLFWSFRVHGDSRGSIGAVIVAGGSI